MPKVRIKNSFLHKLLSALAISGGVIIAASNPFFGIKILKGIEKELKLKKWQNFYGNIRKLKKQKRIDVLQNPDGSYLVTLTQLGKREVTKYDLENLCIIKPEIWDGYWRLVSFDIPTKKKLTRQSFLNKLKELGFIMVQRSLWAHPYECRKELAVIAKSFEIEPYIYTFVVHDADREQLLRKQFQKNNNLTLVT